MQSCNYATFATLQTCNSSNLQLCNLQLFKLATLQPCDLANLQPFIFTNLQLSKSANSFTTLQFANQIHKTSKNIRSKANLCDFNYLSLLEVKFHRTWRHSNSYPRILASVMPAKILHYIYFRPLVF